MRTLFALAASALLVLGVAHAGTENDGLLKEIRKDLEDAKPQAVCKLLTPSACEALARDAADAALVCSYAAVYARSLTEDTSDPEDIQPMLDAFLSIGAQAVERNGKDFDAHVALAKARLAVARHHVADDGTVRPEDWRAVAEAYWDAARCAAGQKHAASALGIYVEGASWGEPQRVALLAEGEAAGRAWLQEHVGDPFGAVGLAEIRFAQARACWDAGDKSGAAAGADEARSLVEDHAGSASPVFDDACAIQNRVVRFLLDTRIDRKAEFRCREEKTRWGYLTFDVPWGSHWSIEHTQGRDEQTMTTIKRFDEMPSNGCTKISFARYRWDVEYTGENKGIGGDNPHGLLDWDRKDDVAFLAKVSRQKKLRRGKLNRQIPKTYGYEIEGVDSDGDRWWIATWYFKGEEGPRTYLVRVARWGPDPGMDSEIQRVLDSVREAPEEGK